MMPGGMMPGGMMPGGMMPGGMMPGGMVGVAMQPSSMMAGTGGAMSGSPMPMGYQMAPQVARGMPMMHPGWMGQGACNGTYTRMMRGAGQRSWHALMSGRNR